jgi:hypothetical protein
MAASFSSCQSPREQALGLAIVLGAVVGFLLASLANNIDPDF